MAMRTWASSDARCEAPSPPQSCGTPIFKIPLRLSAATDSVGYRPSVVVVRRAWRDLVVQHLLHSVQCRGVVKCKRGARDCRPQQWG